MKTLKDYILEESLTPVELDIENLKVAISSKRHWNMYKGRLANEPKLKYSLSRPAKNLLAEIGYPNGKTIMIDVKVDDTCSLLIRVVSNSTIASAERTYAVKGKFNFVKFIETELTEIFSSAESLKEFMNN